MTLYTAAIAVHVVVAVLGIGIVGAVPLTARFARQSVATSPASDRLLGTLLRATQVAFVAMVLTGVLLDVSAGGAFHHTSWFKTSIAVLPLIGVAHARARSVLKKGFAPGGVREVALGKVERWGWTMCAAVAVITVLMQIKPLS